MKTRGIAYFPLAIMALMIVVIILSVLMEHPASKLLPLIIGGAVFVLAGIVLRSEIRASHRSSETASGREAAAEKGTAVSWGRYLVAGAWIVGFFLVIYLLGFMIAIPLFIFAYMKSHGTRWLTTVIFTILAPLLIYGVFELLLNVDLYRGILLPH